MHLRVEDSGLYTVRAVNRWGEAISQATLRIIGTKRKIFYTTQYSKHYLGIAPSFRSLIPARSSVTSNLDIAEQQRYIEQMEALENYQKQQHQCKSEPEPPESIAPPEFITPIKSQKNIPENGFAHFDARLEPLNDSTLRVEWLKDGRPIEASKLK